MSRSFALLKRLGYTGRNRPPLRAAIAAWSRLRARCRGGGMIYVEDARLLPALLAVAGRTPRRRLTDYVRELLDDAPLRETFDQATARYGLTKFRDWPDLVGRSAAQAALFYGMVREIEPEVLVETGTATGSMTSFLLAALHRNGKGRLTSIDIPPREGRLTMDGTTLAQSEVGYFIPEAYRDRWTYLRGDAKLLLPRVLAECPVDVFFHDSLHTRTHMVFEYAVARALLPETAMILSDDVLWNNGYDDFLALHRLVGYAPFGNPNISGFVNRFDDFERRTGIGIVRD